MLWRFLKVYEVLFSLRPLSNSPKFLLPHSYKPYNQVQENNVFADVVTQSQALLIAPTEDNEREGDEKDVAVPDDL